MCNAALAMSEARAIDVTHWGTGPFQNQHAMEWVENLENHADLEMVEETLDNVLEQEADGEIPEIPDCSAALAAAETVAALAKKPAQQLPEEVRQWCFDNPELDIEEVKAKAVQAVGTILTESELRELWSNTEHYPTWEIDLEALRDRLLQ